MESFPARMEKGQEPAPETEVPQPTELAVVEEEGLLSPAAKPSRRPEPGARGGDDHALVVSATRPSPDTSEASGSGTSRTGQSL